MPVYNAPTADSACLQSLATILLEGQTAILIDDARADDDIDDVLQGHVGNIRPRAAAIGRPGRKQGIQR